MRSLRARLVATTVAVALVALGIVALLSRRVVQYELRRHEAVERQGRLDQAAALLERETSAPDMDAALGRLGYPFVLLGPDGSVIAAFPPALREARFEADSSRLVVEMAERAGPVASTKRMVLMGAPFAEIRGPLPGRLYALPDPRGEGAPVVRAVDQRLLIAALLSAAVAVVLALAVSRRILAPVEAVTEAARRMAAGDREHRVAVTGRDEVGELAAAFNAMADAVGRSEAARRGLVADVAHELRTPLTNLRCHLEAVQDGLQSPDAATLASLHEETVLLARLVDDLQELSLAEAGQLALHPVELDVAAVVEAAVEAMRPAAEAKGVALRADVPPCRAHADETRTAQVLRNLLSNAITHTAAGGSVTVSAAASTDVVAVEVADTGDGIPAEHLPHVFDRFHRVDPSRARATGGAGLGLAIVRQLVEAQGGTVSVRSEPGRGAAFRFTLPALTGSSQEPRIPS
jgi:signal transduction histidine kinase